MRRRVRRIANGCLAIGLSSLAPGCDDSPSPQRAVTPTGSAQPSVAQLEHGKLLFAKHCAICHGEQGDGQGRFAYLLNPQPRDFLTGKFKLTTTVNQIPTDADLLRTIRNGMPGSAMPPWSHLAEEELTALAVYVRHLGDAAVRERIARDVEEGLLSQEDGAEEIAAFTVPGDPIPIPTEPPFDEERWFRGRRVYLEACAACHGRDGEPDPLAELKEDEAGFPVSPRSFVRGVFKGGSDGPQLYARIVMGMRGTPMPAYEGLYSPDEMWDLVHYIQSLAQAGSQDRAWLRRGTIVAKSITDGELPSEPMADAWEQAPPTYVSLTPLWWRPDRVEGLLVQALHDETEIVLRLMWLDATADEQAVRVQDFRDGVAIQFSATPDPPFYMGQPGAGGGVTLWYWKADRQRNLRDGYQDEDHAYPQRVVDLYPSQITSTTALTSLRAEQPAEPVARHDSTYITGWGAGNPVSDPKATSPVEVLAARGPGTLSARPAIDQVVRGNGTYHNGTWYVQMRRSLTLTADAESNGDTQIPFRTGGRVPLSFAVWDGAMADRDGRKQISIWQELVIK